MEFAFKAAHCSVGPGDGTAPQRGHQTQFEALS